MKTCPIPLHDTGKIRGVVDCMLNGPQLFTIIYTWVQCICCTMCPEKKVFISVAYVFLIWKSINLIKDLLVIASVGVLYFCLSFKFKRRSIFSIPSTSSACLSLKVLPKCSNCLKTVDWISSLMYLETSSYSNCHKFH